MKSKKILFSVTFGKKKKKKKSTAELLFCPAQLKVIEFQAGKLVFNLSCVDHKDEESIDRYMIDIFMVVFRQIEVV